MAASYRLYAPDHDIAYEYSQSKPGQAVKDVVCVGFGLSSVAIAAAFAENSPGGKICFLERRPTFLWASGEISPDNRTRTPFLRDLITSQNPRSKFTFHNYLYSTNQLVAFTNASSLYPSRLLMGQYLEWVAGQIDKLGWVSYGSEVVHVEPLKDLGASKISSFAVHYQDLTTGERSVMISKKVVIATGSDPYIPSALSSTELASHVLHSSASHGLFSENVARFPDVAIVGATQEAAEFYESVQEHQGGHRATLFIEDSALRPNDMTAL